MRARLIAIGVGLFAGGALWGWALTGDAWESRMLKEHREWEDLLRDKTDHIFALQEELKTPQQKWDEAVMKLANEGLDLGKPMEEIVAEARQLKEELGLVEVEESEVVEIVSPIEEVSEIQEEKSPGESEDETRTNLQRLIDDFTERGQNAPPPDNYISDVDPGVDPKLMPRDSTPPFVISEAEYAGDEEGMAYSKITITYYPQQRILLDDEKDPIDDVAATVGWKNLSQFGHQSSDPDVVFIRNRRLLTDFEVYRETESGPPLHVQFGMSKTEYDTHRAAGFLKFKPEEM